jgi:hypothetical protein
MRVSLFPYPDETQVYPEAISVEFEREGGLLWLRYVVNDNPDFIAWPGEASVGRADNLWKHTCFEAFVTTDDGYREFNLSPSGQWASYRFDSYRQGIRPADEVCVVEGLDGGADYVALEGRVELPVEARKLALSAVIETVDGAKTYWALAHPSDKPDFHHPESFVLDLP